MPRRAATMASSYCSARPRLRQEAPRGGGKGLIGNGGRRLVNRAPRSGVERNRGPRALPRRGLGRLERAEDEAERRDVRKPSAEPFGELARAQGELLEPGRVVRNHRKTPGRERLGPRPPRNVGADD